MIAPLRLSALALLTLLLAACAAPVTRSTSQPAPVIDGSASLPPEPQRYPSTPPTAPPIESRVPATATGGATGSAAVVALAERADQQYAARDLDAAAASLERALRIEPRNAALWQRLAAVRLDQGQTGQAIQLASKSNSLAGGNPGLQARNWRLIAAARRAEGDLKGARAAEEQARQLE